MNEETVTLPIAAENPAVLDTGEATASEPFGDETVAEATPEQEPCAAAKTAENGDDTLNPAESSAQQLHTRLANDFRVLAAEMPEIKAFSDLPDAVISLAVEQDIPLFDAYLRHSFYENKRIGAAKTAAESAAISAVGSLAAPPSNPNPEVDAFVHALRQSLR